MPLSSSYRMHNYMGEYANDSDCLTFIRANKWDSIGNGSGNPRSGMQYFNTTSNKIKIFNGTAWEESASGDIVTGPASATDNAIARFDDVTGKLIQNSSVTIDDSGSINIPSGQKYKINNVNLSASDVGAAATSHTHGNLSSDGKVGSTANLPLITGTDGLIQASSFGTAANTFCVGNDSRLSDARTPTSHTHGNITNTGGIGTDANIPIITGTLGILKAGSFGTAASTFCEGNDSRLSDARTPTAHTLVGHTASGLTTGHFLKATGATTYAFAAHGLTYTDVGAAATSHTHPVSNISDSTTVGQNLVKLANPSAIRFVRINADNTVSALTAADFKTAIDVIGGAASSTDNAIVRWDGITGKIVQNSTSTMDDSGNTKIGGSIGIGGFAHSADAKMTFGTFYNSAGTNVVSAIRLYETTSVAYGFGITDSTLNICANQSSAKIDFYAGTNHSPTPTFRMRISAGGNVGIGILTSTTAPASLLTLGNPGTKAGDIALAGATSGTCTIQVAAAAGTSTIFQLPANNGTSGYVLQTNGTGVTSWVAASSGGTPGGSDTHVQYNNSGAFGGVDTFRWDNSTQRLILGKVGGAAGLQFAGSTSGVVTVQSAAAAGTWVLTLPTSAGASGRFLRTDGAGVTSWVAQSTNASTFTVSTLTTDTTCFPVFVATATGSQSARTNSYFLYNSVSGLLTLGASAASKTGLLGFAGSTSGLVTLTAAAAAGTWTMTLPTTGGTNGHFLQTNGSGVTTWAAASATPAGSSSQIQYNDNGVFGATNKLTWDSTNSRLYVGYVGDTTHCTLHVSSPQTLATIGSEMVTNGSFTGGTTGWTLETNWAYGSNNVVLTVSGVSGALSQSVVLEANSYYLLAWQQTHSIALNASINPGLAFEVGGNFTSVSTGTQTVSNVFFHNASAGTYTLSFGSSNRTDTGTVTVDNVSLKKITPKIACTRIQTTGTNILDLRIPQSQSISLGFEAGICTPSGVSSSISIGWKALARQAAGSLNTVVGVGAMQYFSNGTENSAFGSYALALARIVTNCVAIGSYAVSKFVNGHDCIGIGKSSMGNLLSGTQNTAIGTLALAGSVGSAYTGNTSVGHSSMLSMVTGSSNSCVGAFSLSNISTGSYNVAMGLSSGRYSGSGTSTNQTSEYCIYLGTLSRASAAGNTNEIVIGANAIGNGSNTTTIGHTTNTGMYLRGDIYSDTAYAKAVGGTNRAMYVNSAGLIGTLPSSLRTKEDVVDMEDIGWIDRLRPVNFCYRSTPGVKQYGLIAEEVEGVNRDLVGYDMSGLPDSVTYDRLVPVLLKAVRELRHEMAQMKLAMLP